MTGDPLKDDFRNFLYVCLLHIGKTDPRVKAPTPIQYDIAEFIQNGPDRIVVEAFRGIGKSWIAAFYCLWCWYCNPQLKIIVLSAAKPRADAFSQFCLQLINEMPLLTHLRPSADQRQSNIAFDVGPAGASQAPSMFSVGIFGAATGFRADVVIFDDVEVPNNSETQMQREKLLERTREAPGAILKPNGRVIVLGTPQTHGSIYNDFPNRGYAVRIWPSEYPDAEALGELVVRYDPKLIQRVMEDPSLVGHSTEPTRFPDEELYKRRLEYGPSGYALQFLLDTRMSDADRYPLRVKDLVMYPLDHLNAPEKILWAALPENLMEVQNNVALPGDRFYRGRVLPDWRFRPYEGTIMYIDPAGRGKDETGYAVVSHLNGLLYLRDIGGLKGYDQDTLMTLAKICKQHKVNQVWVERNFGDGMFTQLLKPVMATVYPVTIEEDDWQTGSKEHRICDILEPVVSSHRLVVDERLIELDYHSTKHLPSETANHYRFFYQFTHITRDKGALRHDDRLDALAGAVRRLNMVVGTDIDEMVKTHREEMFKAELDEFYATAHGRPPVTSGGCCPWA